MNDKELLEWAAKAAGFKREDFVDGKSIIREVDGQPVYWNPLTDDGDALRLAVKLRMHVSIFADAIGIGTPGGGYTETKWVDDANVATRRAIVCAAAEIGKAM
jgi:hypothetical protein